MMSWEPKPEVVFAVIAALFGVAFAFSTPALDPADELRHFQRAYLLSEGEVAPPGQAVGYEGAIPRSLIEVHQPPHRWLDRSGRSHPGQVPGAVPVCSHDLETLWNQRDDALEPERRTVLSSTTPQGPLAYLPQAMALLPGRLLDLPPIFLLLVGRLANVLTWVVAGWLAIRLAPIRRWTIALLCLSPMAVFLSGSLSADTPTNAVSIVFLAGVLRVAYPREPSPPLARNQFGALVAAGAMLGAMKPGYGVLTAVLLLIPRERFRSRSQQWSLIAAVPAATLATSALWMLALVGADQVFPNPDPGSRLSGLLNSPLVFIERVLTTFGIRGWEFFRGFVGTLGHLDVHLPLALYVAYPLALLGVTLLEGPDPAGLTLARRALLVGVFVLGALAILAQLYVGTGSPASMVIPGLQGRHLIPLAPLLLLAIPSRWSASPGALAAGVAAASALSLAVAVASVVGHYYR